MRLLIWKSIDSDKWHTYLIPFKKHNGKSELPSRLPAVPLMVKLDLIVIHEVLFQALLHSL